VQRQRGSLRGYIEIVLVTLVIGIVVKTFVLGAIRIPSPSMESTLHRGDFVLVNKLVYGAPIPWVSSSSRAGFSSFHLPKIRSIARGDVIVFELPPQASPGSSDPVYFVKRCVGVGGDVVSIHDGSVFVNGKHFDTGSTDDTAVGDFGPVQVPSGSLFVLGDNREHSYDSRYWGFLPVSNVIGQVIMVYWSVDISRSTHTIAALFSSIRWNRIGTFVH
jgi:signal peptidase I